MITLAAVLPLIVSSVFARVHSVESAAQARRGTCAWTIETTYSVRATRQAGTHSSFGSQAPWTPEVGHLSDAVVSSVAFFRDRPAPPLRDAPQDDAAAYFRTIDLVRCRVTSTYERLPPHDEWPGYWIEDFSSPLEGEVLRVRPTLGDAALIADPNPGPQARAALKISIVDPRLPHLARFLDREPGRPEPVTADFAVIPELYAMAQGTASDQSQRPGLFVFDPLFATCWDLARWEPLERTVTCSVDSRGRTIQRTTETPISCAQVFEIRWQDVPVSTHGGWASVTGDIVETLAMVMHGTLSLTVDVRSGEALALCLDLTSQVDRTLEAPGIPFASTAADAWEGTVTLRLWRASRPSR